MKRVVFFFSLLVLIFPLKTKAILCSNEDKVTFQTLARNITTSYTDIEQNGTISFQITLSNIYEGFIIKDVKNNVTYPYRGSEFTISNLNANTSYRFDVYVDALLCDDELLYSHYVNTPAYNPYYQDEICEGMENYTICQKLTNMTLSYEEFKQKVESLKTTVEEPVEEPQEIYEKGIYDYILEFYLDYYYIVLPIFIVGGILTIYCYNKKNKLF